MQDTLEPPSAIPIFTRSSQRSAITALPRRLRQSREEPCDSTAIVSSAAVVPMPPSSLEASQSRCEPDASGSSTPGSTRGTTTSRDDARLLAILDAPLFAGEAASVGFARKERELRGAFKQLLVVEAHLLHKRLANPARGDRLAEKFVRLTAERRSRLLQFLADARRRAAVAGWR